MDDNEDELRARVQGLTIAVNVFLNAPLRREEFHERFRQLLDDARKRNAHAATIEVLRDLVQRLAP